VEKSKKRLSASGLYTYLAFGSVQEPLTMIEGITSIPPASWMQIISKGEKLKIKQGRYWSPPAPIEEHSENIEIKTCLVDAVSSTS